MEVEGCRSYVVQHEETCLAYPYRLLQVDRIAVPTTGSSQIIHTSFKTFTSISNLTDLVSHLSRSVTCDHGKQQSHPEGSPTRPQLYFGLTQHDNDQRQCTFLSKCWDT